jgi:phospholipid-binding lipoprotein MlaA
VATDVGLKRRTNNFGLTLARWGWRQSAYIVAPIFGSYTIRDLFGSQMDYFALSIYPRFPWKTRYGLVVLAAISYRENLLGLEDVVNQAALDPYVFFRDAYLQKQQVLIQQNDATALEGHGQIAVANQSSPNRVSSSDPDVDILNSLD